MTQHKWSFRDAGLGLCFKWNDFPLCLRGDAKRRWGFAGWNKLFISTDYSLIWLKTIFFANMPLSLCRTRGSMCDSRKLGEPSTHTCGHMDLRVTEDMLFCCSATLRSKTVIHPTHALTKTTHTCTGKHNFSPFAGEKTPSTTRTNACQIFHDDISAPCTTPPSFLLTLALPSSPKQEVNFWV